MYVTYKRVVLTRLWLPLTRAGLGQDWTQDCRSFSNSSKILSTRTENIRCTAIQSSDLNEDKQSRRDSQSHKHQFSPHWNACEVGNVQSTTRLYVLVPVDLLMDSLPALISSRGFLDVQIVSVDRSASIECRWIPQDHSRGVTHLLDTETNRNTLEVETRKGNVTW